MTLISAANLLAATDRVAGRYATLLPVLATLTAALVLDADFYYGGPSTGGVSLQDGTVINAVGSPVVKAQAKVSGNNITSYLLGDIVSGLSSYMTQVGKNNALPLIIDVPSFLRYSNGCPNPAAAANGLGTNYAYLVHPVYAQLVSLLLNGTSVLPPDVVFAPAGLVLGTFHFAAGGTFATGRTLMTASSAPYAPVGPLRYVVRAGQVAGAAYSGNLPNGALYVVMTGVNQAGVSVTWRGDAGTGLAGLGGTLAPGTLKGTDGGANGGTAAPTDRLVQITGIALDAARASTSTQGDIDIIAVAERPTL